MVDVGEASPKSQTQLVIVPDVAPDKSVNVVGVPAQTTFEEKLATGNGFTTTVCVLVLVHPLFDVQVSVTV